MNDYSFTSSAVSRVCVLISEEMNEKIEQARELEAKAKILRNEASALSNAYGVITKYLY